SEDHSWLARPDASVRQGVLASPFPLWENPPLAMATGPSSGAGPSSNQKVGPNKDNPSTLLRELGEERCSSSMTTGCAVERLCMAFLKLQGWMNLLRTKCLCFFRSLVDGSGVGDRPALEKRLTNDEVECKQKKRCPSEKKENRAKTHRTLGESFRACAKKGTGVAAAVEPKSPQRHKGHQESTKN